MLSEFWLLNIRVAQNSRGDVHNADSLLPLEARAGSSESIP